MSDDSWVLIHEDGTRENLDLDSEADASEAHEEARDRITSFDYHAESGSLETIWVDYSIMCGDFEDSGTVTIDPPEPPCDRDYSKEHTWESPHEIVGGMRENPGVFGKGGGVFCVSVCKCGWTKTEDSWATRPDNGRQGLESVSYSQERGREIARWVDKLESEAEEAGTNDGESDVMEIANSQGVAGIIQAMAPGSLQWDEGARNAFSHQHSNVPDDMAEIYYSAYARAAKLLAASIIAEHPHDGKDLEKFIYS